MARYRYMGFDPSGARVSGVVESDRLDLARDDLHGRGVLVSELAPETTGKDWRETLGLQSDRVRLDDLEFLTAELSLLLDSGVRIDRAIGILQRTGRSGAVGQLLAGLTAELKQGRQLSEAAAARTDVFDPLYVNLIALGEASGRLPEVFRRLAEDLRFRREIRQKVLQAASYPLVVLGVCVVALLFIFNFVVPNLATLFADASELPWYTSALLGASAFMQQYQWVLAVALVAVVALLWQSRRRPAVVEFNERLAIGAPFLREATTTVERIRFTSGLGMMLEAGLPVDRALALATGSIRHGQLRREIAIAVEKVRRGEQLSGVLRQTRLFPDYYASLLEVGEESGELGRVFTEVARRSRDAFAQWTQRVTTLLEPMLILLMGLIVGGVVVIMMLSITSVADIGL
ncbi:MAG: type II secretion system F family protein [Steroidobacteraceae bacterium]|nr:type II secretion system F family protein [Steroidobacteraceae bacterium]